MSEIPVNTRVIGEPKGEELFYFEDYVYTFMKRVLEECRRQDCEVAFYGAKTYRNGAEVYIISGATQIKKEQQEQDYFAAHTFLGRGWIERGMENDVSVILITQEKKKIQKEDFYIYYSQNEEMQNYMIGWNQAHHGAKNRAESNDAVRYTRMVQNHNKEEVRISFLWNVMNVLGLSFIVCVMVYAIVSMNHYYKMKDMEENLAYVISVMSDSVHMQTMNSDIESQKEQLSEEQQQQEYFAKENEMQELLEIEESNQEVSSTIIENTSSETENRDERETQQMLETSGQVSSMTQVSEMKEYIVQEGDTLRSIAYMHYGRYDMVDAICAENHITDANNILSGQKLLLP